MNLRNTAILFALFLTTLWLFGVMLVTKQPLAEEGFLFPKLKNVEWKDVDSIDVELNRDGKKATYRLVRSEDTWQLVVDGLTTAVEGAQVEPLFKALVSAKHNVDAQLSRDLAEVGLAPPRRSYTFKGRPTQKSGRKGDEQSWTISLGNESADADKMFIPAVSSERPGEVFALPKTEIEALLFDEPLTLKSQVFFNFALDPGAVRKVSVTSPKEALELSRTDDGLWRFDKPALGYAQFEAPPPPPLKGLGIKEKTPEGGVKGLIFAIRTLRVTEETDFEPLGKASLASYGLEEGKEAYRLEVVSVEQKKKAVDVLLIGKEVPDSKGKKVYARLKGDPAVARINAAQLDLIKEMLGDPSQLRSREVTLVQENNLRAIQLEQGEKRVELTREEGKDWQVQVGTGKPQKAEKFAVDGLLEALRGKNESFEEPKDPKNADKEFGTDAPQLEVKLIERAPEPEDEEKDKAKDKAKDKDKEKEKDKTTRLLFGKKAGDAVYVKRIMPDGYTDYFKVLVKVLDGIRGEDLNLAYLEQVAPSTDPNRIVGVTLTHGGRTIELRRDPAATTDKWVVKDTRDSTGFVAADDIKVRGILNRWGKRLLVSRWLRKLDDKEDLKAIGLDAPAGTLTLTLLDAPALGAALGQAVLPTELAGLAALACLTDSTRPAAAATVTYRFGIDNKLEAEKRGVYATHSGSDLLFLVEPTAVEVLYKTEFRDLQTLTQLQPALAAGLFAPVADHPLHLFSLVSPFATRQLHLFDPAKTREVKLALRTPAELRRFTFARDTKTKDAPWKDLSGLVEFDLDSTKVDQFVKNVAEAEGLLLVSITGPRGDQKLNEKEAALLVELIQEDGTKLILIIGAAMEDVGYYAHSSAQKELVFVLPKNLAESWMRGLSIFAKEKVALR